MKLSRLRLALIAGATAIGITSYGAAASAVDVPLPEAGMPALESIVKSALAKSPRTMARDFELLNAQYGQMVSSSRLYPQAGGSYQLQFRQEDRGGTEDRDSGERNYYNLTITQALWHWGTVRASARMGRLSALIAEQNLESVRREVALEVRNAYLGLIIQKLGLRNIRFAETLAREALALEEERFKAKETTAAALSGARLRAEETSLAADRAASDLGFAIEAFRRLTGVETFTEADIPDRVVPPRDDPPPADPEAGRGYLKSEALLMNELQLERGKLENLIDRKALWPKLNAVAGVSQDDSIFITSLDRRIQNRAAFFGFSLSWTLFDGFASKGRRLQSRNRLQQLENTRADLLTSLKNTADQNAANVGFTWRTYKIAATRLRGATSRLNSERANLERGLSSEELIAQARAGLNQAELAADDALAKFYTAAARYASTMRTDPLIDGTPDN